MFLPHEVDQKSRRRRGRGSRSCSQLNTGIIRVLLVALAITLIRGTLQWWHHSRNSQSAKIAFFIQVSSESLFNIPRLMRTLHHPENIYFVHFDSKISEESMSSVRTLFNNSHYRNVYVLPSEPVTYAGVSMLVNTLNAITTALEHEWDYFINLSGSDYPLLSSDAIRRLLGNPAVLKERLNFLQSQVSDKNRNWFINKRLRRLHVDTTMHSTSTKQGVLIDLNISNPIDFTNVPFVKSEAWVILHRSFCRHSVFSASGRRLLVSYATARASDELFFGTLLSQSEEFRSTMTWDSFRFVKWGIHETRWSRPGYLDELGSQIREELTISGAFFARKFRNSESTLMDFIDSQLSGNTEFDYRRNDSSTILYSSRAEERLRCAATFRSVTEGCIQESLAKIKLSAKGYIPE